MSSAVSGQNTLVELPVISMWQPWGSWVAWGWKPIETRTHARFASLVGQRAGFHAAKRFDERARHIANHYLSDGQARSAGRSDNYPRGLICTAYVREFRRLTRDDARGALIECDTPRFGLFLEDVHLLPKPLECVGRQGIWRMICPASVHGSYVKGVSFHQPDLLSSHGISSSVAENKKDLGETGGVESSQP